MEWPGPLFQRSAKHPVGFLTPVVAELGRREWRVAAVRYVQGLLMRGQRKPVEPMAQRLAVGPHGLQQFVSDGPWSDQAVWKVVRQQIIPHLEPMEAWVVDETGWLKQGQHSVGVSPQYCGSVDAAYGDNAEFRAGVRALGMEFFLQVDAAKPKGWSFAVPTELKQTRRHPSPAAPPSQTLAELAAAIPPEQWQSAH